MKKILIIEDDESISSLERDYLEAHNYLVTIVSSGLKGLEAATRGDYNLIVLDIMLPEIDGFTILKKLRETVNIPVLLVSAKSVEIDKIKGLNLGADDYITKPFNFNEFVARVDSHINRFERLTEKPTITRLVFDGLIIEPSTRRVIAMGDDVSLANKEFELLLLLAQNPNIVFNKEKLMDVIWGYDSLGDAGTVAVHIKRIREKIEKNPNSKKYIETIWGAGYSFRVN